jgi:peptide/nickel transport system permease protein
MARYLLHRLFFLLVSFIAALLLIFVLLRLLPGDPANAFLSLNATPEQIAVAESLVHSDAPLLQQYTDWFINIFRGDFGKSFIAGTPVLPDVIKRFSVTLPLTLITFILSTIIASLAGFIAAYKNDKWYAGLLTGFTQMVIAIPVFWIGIIFVWIFALTLHILPSGGWPNRGWQEAPRAIRALLLPSITIVFVMSAALSRYIRSSVLNVLDSGYIRTSRALGYSAFTSFVLHGIRNAYVPIVSILGIEFSTTFIGAVMIETIFSLPGLGSMLTKAIAQHDYPVIQGILLITTFIVLIIGFFSDVVQRILDPRLRISRENT